MICNKKCIEMRDCALKNLAKISFLPPLLARITLGVVFIQSGWGKLHHLERTVEYFVSLGIPAASIQAPFVAGVEFVGGILILIGLFTRLASFMLMGTMIVAIITALWPGLQDKLEVFGLSEVAYLIMFLWLVVDGAGRVSVDEVLSSRCR